MEPPDDATEHTMMLAPGASAPAEAGSRALHVLVPVEAPEGALRVVAEPRTIGRSPSCDLSLADRGVSGRHASVRLDGDDVLVRDLGSTNGTFIAGVRVAGETPLPVGALLHLATVTLRHELRDATAIAEEEEWGADLKRAARYITELLPDPWRAPPLQVEWRLAPSRRLGGDSFGYAWLGEREAAFWLADVCGHGLPAALHSIALLHALRQRTLPADPRDPGAVVTALHRAFPMEQHGGMYCTFWYGVLDVERRRLRYASAGHPPALVRDPAAAGLIRLRQPRPPIGMVEGLEWSASEVALAPGAALYLFSDGVFEEPGPDGRPLGLPWLEEAILAAPDAVAAEPARIELALRRATGARRFQDDFTLIVAELPR